MLVKATRTISAYTLRALFYGALFASVAIVHVALTTALRTSGWQPGPSLFASGVVVLMIVLVLVNVADRVRERRAAHREIERMRQGLPGGPCCVVWREGEPGEGADMPWRVKGALRARFPPLARRLGVEGVAVVDFEINAEGAAKNVHCIHAWPSDVFFAAAREALSHARFAPKPGARVRFGVSYRIPFVFRIAGAAKLTEAGLRASAWRPALQAASEVIDKLRRSA